MIKRFFVFIIFFSLFSINCIAGIFFANENLNEKNELLFTVKQTIPGAVSYTSLFYAEISSGKPKENPKPVTCYPEQMELYGQSIRIRNRYGSAIYNTASQRLVWQEYAKSIPLNSMRLSPYVSSPDGKWNCYVQKTGYAQGCLIFENTETGEKAKLDESANFSYSSVPVLWSGDSSLVVYCKNDTLFFCSPDALLSGLEIDEPYREIGRGAVSSVCWAGNTLFYIDGDMLYKINVKELYTLGLYSKIIGKGTPCGRLAEKFDPKTDAFSVNRQNSELLLIKAGKVFSQYIIGGITSEYLALRFSRPYINSESALLDCEVLWSNDGSPYIWMHLIPFTGDKAKSTVYRIAESFVPLFSISNSYRPVISADRSRVVFFADGEAYVYNVSNWKKIAELSGENFLSAVWKGNDELYIGGEYFVRKWNVVSNTSEILFLSSASEGLWSKDSKQIAIRSGNGSLFVLDAGKTKWTQYDDELALSNKIVQNGRYRVFCNKSVNTRFENAIYIRTLSRKAVTLPVFPESTVKTEERKKVALVFDAYESADGLPSVIASLSTYNVQAAFCLNGEFIRRYPKETRLISSTGNTCASMFFSTSDLTQVGFIADETFVRRGLARNEDEFYKCTGKELSLLWHAPYYKANRAIKSAGEKAGYSYIEVAGIIEPYFFTSESTYTSASSLIEKHLQSLEKNSGGVVPIVLGFPENERREYVYRNLDLLISAILDSGFDIVSIREVVQ